MIRSVPAHVWAFDLEWAPDLASGRRAYNLPLNAPDGDVYARFGIPAQPAMVVVNLAGDVMSRLGPVEAADLDAALEDAGG